MDRSYRVRTKTSLVTIAAILLTATALLGQTSTRQDTLKELIRRIEILTEEIEEKKLGAVAEDKYESKFGMGPAASRIYHLTKPGASIAGYGEAVYNAFANVKEDGSAAGQKNQIDFLRQIIYVGFRFNDWILLNTEIEFEHAKAGDGQPGQVAVEFGYIDLQFQPAFNLRTGMVLIPVGIINEFHEPTTFQGALRPETERFIIPEHVACDRYWICWRDTNRNRLQTISHRKSECSQFFVFRCAWRPSTWCQSNRGRFWHLWKIQLCWLSRT